MHRTCGAIGIASKRRGRCLGNTIGDEVRQQALATIKECYSDFGPTFSHEKLTELHDFHFSVETLRKWMIEDGLWLGKWRKKACIHQSRPRRPRLGELVQIDGSPHDWFEGCTPRCNLIVFIDDATSRLYVQDVLYAGFAGEKTGLALHFSPTETTHAYMETLNQQIDKHGRPAAIYSDKHSETFAR